MCTLDNIKLSVIVVNVVKGLLTLYVMIIGGIFATTDAYHKAYGIFMVSNGAGLILIGLLSLSLMIPFAYSIKRHNRFVLLVCFFLESLVLSQLIYLGNSFYVPTIPTFDKSLQNDCLQHKFTTYTKDECELYLQSDRFAGFKLTWAGYYSKVSTANFYKLLSDIEDASICCGFGPPLRCVNDSRPYPPDRPTAHVRSVHKQRTVCGYIDNYYLVEDNCVHFFDEFSNPKIIGGCNYEMPAGGCRHDDISSSTKGCGDAFERYMGNLVAPHALVVMGASAINFLAILISCCMWWKRKETDTFPDFLKDEAKKKKTINYSRIKDNVVVVPVTDYLYEKGFLPDPRKKVYIQEESKHEVPVDVP